MQERTQKEEMKSVDACNSDRVENISPACKPVEGVDSDDRTAEEYRDDKPMLTRL
jgi:hypothetical protein